MTRSPVSSTTLLTSTSPQLFTRGCLFASRGHSHRNGRGFSIRNGELQGNGSIYKDDPAYAITAPTLSDSSLSYTYVCLSTIAPITNYDPITSPITQPSPAGDDTTEPFPLVRPFLDDLPNPISDPSTNPNNIILQPVKELRRSSSWPPMVTTREDSSRSSKG